MYTINIKFFISTSSGAKVSVAAAKTVSPGTQKQINVLYKPNVQWLVVLKAKFSAPVAEHARVLVPVPLNQKFVKESLVHFLPIFHYPWIYLDQEKCWSIFFFSFCSDAPIGNVDATWAVDLWERERTDRVFALENVEISELDTMNNTNTTSANNLVGKCK